MWTWWLAWPTTHDITVNKSSTLRKHFLTFFPSLSLSICIFSLFLAQCLPFYIHINPPFYLHTYGFNCSVSRQWPAVTSHLSLISAHPQICCHMNCSDPCQGQAPGLASCPPAGTEYILFREKSNIYLYSTAQQSVMLDIPVSYFHAIVSPIVRKIKASVLCEQRVTYQWYRGPWHRLGWPSTAAMLRKLWRLFRMTPLWGWKINTTITFRRCGYDHGTPVSNE